MQDPVCVLPDYLGSFLDMDSQGDLDQPNGGQCKASGMRRGLEHSEKGAAVFREGECLQ